MKQSLKHMFEISGGISLCFLVGAITSIIMSSYHTSGYGSIFLQGALGLSAIVFVVSILCLVLLNIDLAKTSIAKRLVADDD